jgi:prepilin-type N-terminal cleavage/methylation domain-containing protein
MGADPGALTMNTRRGLTLIELLFALALLGSLSVAAVQWTALTARRQHDQSEYSAWHAAADNALDLIERDLLMGDLSPGDDQDRAILGSWIIEDDGSLSVDTRIQGIGAVRRTFEFTDARLIATLSKPGEEPDRSVLLGRVEGCRIRALPEKAGSPISLEVTIEGPKTWAVSRTIDLGVARDD